MLRIIQIVLAITGLFILNESNAASTIPVAYNACISSHNNNTDYNAPYHVCYIAWNQSKGAYYMYGDHSNDSIEGPYIFRTYSEQLTSNCPSGTTFNVNTGNCDSNIPQCNTLICSDIDQPCETEGQSSVVKACSINLSTATPPVCVTGTSGNNAGKTLCLDDTVQGSGSIDGVPFTANDSTMTCIELTDSNGKQVPICAGGEKNCGLVNGVYRCVESYNTLQEGTQNGNAPIGCITNDSGKILCIKSEDGYKSDISQTVVTNPDGSTTETTIKSDNVVNTTNQVTTTTNNVDGSITTTQTGTKSNTDSTDSSNLQGINDKLTTNNSILDQIKQGQIDGNQILNNLLGHPENYDASPYISETQNAVNADVQSSIDYLNESTNPLSGVSNTHANDWLPTFPEATCTGGIDTTIFGRPFVLDPCVKLAPLREVLAWVFYILTVMSVVKITFSAVE